MAHRILFLLSIILLLSCSSKNKNYESLMHGKWVCITKASSQGFKMYATGKTTMNKEHSTFTSSITITTSFDANMEPHITQHDSSGFYKINDSETTYYFSDTESKVIKGYVSQEFLDKVKKDKLDNPVVVDTIEIDHKTWISQPKGNSKIRATCTRTD